MADPNIETELDEREAAAIAATTSKPLLTLLRYCAVFVILALLNVALVFFAGG